MSVPPPCPTPPPYPPPPPAPTPPPAFSFCSNSLSASDSCPPPPPPQPCWPSPLMPGPFWQPPVELGLRLCGFRLQPGLAGLKRLVGEMEGRGWMGESSGGVKREMNEVMYSQPQPCPPSPPMPGPFLQPPVGHTPPGSPSNDTPGSPLFPPSGFDGNTPFALVNSQPQPHPFPLIPAMDMSEMSGKRSGGGCVPTPQRCQPSLLMPAHTPSPFWKTVTPGMSELGQGWWVEVFV